MFCALPWPEKEFSSTHKANISRNYRASLLTGPSTEAQSQSLEEGWVSPAVVHRVHSSFFQAFSLQAVIEFEWIGQYKEKHLLASPPRNSHCPSVVQRRDPVGSIKRPFSFLTRNLKGDIYLGLNCASP